MSENRRGDFFDSHCMFIKFDYWLPIVVLVTNDQI